MGDGGCGPKVYDKEMTKSGKGDRGRRYERLVFFVPGPSSMFPHML